MQDYQQSQQQTSEEIFRTFAIFQDQEVFKTFEVFILIDCMLATSEDQVIWARKDTASRTDFTESSEVEIDTVRGRRNDILNSLFIPHQRNKPLWVLRRTAKTGNGTKMTKKTWNDSLRHKLVLTTSSTPSMSRHRGTPHQYLRRYLDGEWRVATVPWDRQWCSEVKCVVG